MKLAETAARADTEEHVYWDVFALLNWDISREGYEALAHALGTAAVSRPAVPEVALADRRAIIVAGR
jgi:hypothetical protein